MSAPIYTQGRSASITVPAGSWYGFDLPNLADAGDYIIGWGMTYNNDEVDDPFRTLLVKISKSTFTVSQNEQIIFNPSNPGNVNPGYTSPVYAVSDGTNLYMCGWNAQSGDVNDVYFTVFTLDIATLTLQQTSNSFHLVCPGGADNVVSSFNEGNGPSFIYGDYVVWCTPGSGYCGIYQISTNTFSMFGGTQDPGLNGISACAVSSTGIVYRMWGDTVASPTTTALDMLASPSTQTITNIGTFTGTIYRDITNLISYPFYLDEPNGLIYTELFNESLSVPEFVQISVATGQIVSTVADTTVIALAVGAIQQGWNGYELCCDENGDGGVYLKDSSGTLTLQTNITLPVDAPDYDGNFFWDGLFSGLTNPIYLNTFNPDDLSEGQVYTCYEFLPPASALSVSPTSLLNFVNHVWGFSPAVGDGSPGFGYQNPQPVTITSSGPWTATSQTGLTLIQPSSGSGNATVLVGISSDFNFPRAIFANRIKTGTYQDVVTFSNGRSSADVPVIYSVGFGDNARETVFTPNLNPAKIS